MPKFSFPLVKSSPTDSGYAEICTGGGSRPPCQLKVMAYSGAATPSDTYGNLSVVNLPLQSETAGCETLIEVYMQTGCPPGTPDVVCDDVQNPTEIAPNSSETIYILDGNPPYTWEITGGHGYSLEHESTNDLGGRPDERLNSQNTLYSSTDSCGTAKVKITDNCQTEVICEFDSSIASDFEYDWTNSAQTAARNANVDVFVTGGTPPYTWYVSGTGFSLQNIETYSATNTVYTDGTACGSGVITVEDVCGVQVEGGVRCTDLSGEWVVIYPGNTVCKFHMQGVCDGQYWIEGIQGEYKIKEHIQTACRNNDHTCPAGDCSGADVFVFDPTVYGGTCLVPGCPDGKITCACWSQNLGGTGCGLGYHATGGDCCALSSTLDNQIRIGVQSRQTWEWRCI